MAHELLNTALPKRDLGRKKLPLISFTLYRDTMTEFSR